MVETPWNADIQNPVPRVGKRYSVISGELKGRWACEPVSGLEPTATKGDFLQSWGDPSRKLATPRGETWIYGEKGSWCGAWIAVGLLVPFELPVCATFDHVEFEGDVAVRSTSRRMGKMGAFLVFSPYSGYPVPIFVRPGYKFENSAAVSTSIDDPKRDRGCRGAVVEAEAPSYSHSALGGGGTNGELTDIDCSLADQGNTEYQSRVGNVFYNEGDKSRRKLIRAYVWYALAVKGNDQLAVDRVELLTRMLSPEELKEARQNLEDWKPGQCIKDLADSLVKQP
jgi:hypothetical protein